MTPRVRAWLAGVAAAVLALVIGSGIANESYVLATCCLLLTCWLLAEWLRGPRPDAWMLVGIIAGYIIGNRGFAQLQLVERFPLLPAEAALLVIVPALAVRMAFKQAQVFRRDALNWVLTFWFLLGAARLPLDVSRYGFHAIRDFAMVYYALFFFAAQAYAGHASSLRVLKLAVSVAFLVLPVSAAVSLLAPNLFLNVLTLHGIPLIFYKSDLLAALLAAGFFWLWTRWEKYRKLAWFVAATACFVLSVGLPSPRAAMVATFGVTLMWIVTGRWRMARAQLGIGAVAVIGGTLIFALSNRNLRETAVYSAYEHAVSIFDFEGKGTYLNRESGDPGDNNRFRLVWWRAVTNETLETNPALGLGFGYDLANRFLADYDMLGAEDFSARSPHSMIMSVFGRMGLIGLALWLTIAGCMVAMTRRAFGTNDWDTIGLISVAWVIWISACFGVVLEGPMGAVVFWTLLGLANAESRPALAAEPAALPSTAASASGSPA